MHVPHFVIAHCICVQAIKYLSAAGFGANLLAVFGNGMVQSFINARTLIPSGTDRYFFDK